MKSVGVYARISSDVLGEGLGVQRQQDDCRALAERHGWRIVDTYVDNDVSAYSGKRRPEYERLLADVRAGRVTGIVAWHPDRLHRSPVELEAFISLVDETRCAVDTVTAGELDLSTPSGRMTARIVGAVARGESEHKSARIRRKLEQNAADGRHHGGERPFGWKADRVTINESEAAIVRQATARVIAGASLRSVTAEINAAGHLNRDGRPWQHVGVRNMVLRPHNAGLRTYRGDVVGAGRWEPIVERADWDTVRRILNDPARLTNPGRDARVHLLSGIARCGRCGGPMRGVTSNPKRGAGRPIYRCDKGCLTRSKSHCDDLVVGVVCARLARADAADLLTPPTADRPDHEAEAAVLRQRLADAAEDYAEGVVTRAQLRTITERLRPRVEQLEAMTPPPAPERAALAALVSADDVREVWAGLDLKQRRTVVDLLLTITVQPTRRGPGFRSEDVHITWKADQ